MAHYPTLFALRRDWVALRSLDSNELSGKMPKPPHTGIVQVNVDDQNTRIVERYVDIAAATAAAQELYGGISRSSMQ